MTVTTAPAPNPASTTGALSGPEVLAMLCAAYTDTETTHPDGQRLAATADLLAEQLDALRRADRATIDALRRQLATVRGDHDTLAGRVGALYETYAGFVDTVRRWATDAAATGVLDPAAADALLAGLGLSTGAATTAITDPTSARR